MFHDWQTEPESELNEVVTQDLVNEIIVSNQFQIFIELVEAMQTLWNLITN